MFMIKSCLLIVSHEHVSVSKHSGRSAAATATTNSASNEAYQELSAMPSTQPVYSQIAR